MHVLVAVQHGCNLDFLFKSWEGGFQPDSYEFYERRTVSHTEARAVKAVALLCDSVAAACRHAAYFLL